MCEEVRCIIFIFVVTLEFVPHLACNASRRRFCREKLFTFFCHHSSKGEY